MTNHVVFVRMAQSGILTMEAVKKGSLQWG
jgi:hypothetical protein